MNCIHQLLQRYIAAMCTDMEFNFVVSVVLVSIATRSKQTIWSHLKNKFLVELRL